MYIWIKTTNSIKAFGDEESFDFFKQRYPDYEFIEITETIYNIWFQLSKIFNDYRRKTGKTLARNILEFLKEHKDFKDRNITPLEFNEMVLAEIKMYFVSKLDTEEKIAKMFDEKFILNTNNNPTTNVNINFNNFADKTQEESVLVPNKTTPFALTTNAKIIISTTINGITTATEHTSKKDWSKGYQIGNQGDDFVMTFNVDGTFTNLGKIAIVLVYNLEDKI